MTSEDSFHFSGEASLGDENMHNVWNARNLIQKLEGIDWAHFMQMLISCSVCVDCVAVTLCKIYTKQWARSRFLD